MSTSTGKSWTDLERVVHERLAAGEVADFTTAGTGLPVVSGRFLSTLASYSLPRGIRLRGARVEGPLDLMDSCVPALILEECELPDKIDVSGARLGRLSIRQSRFRYLFARAATIDAGLDFSSAAALANEAWIDAGRATIRGCVDGCDAHLRAPAARPRAEVRPWSHNYALRLSESAIHGSILLNGKFIADGGFSMDDAYVHGSVKARGATFIAGEGDDFHPGDSLRAHTARIDGQCEFGFGFKTVGRVWMLGAKIRDRLTIGMIRAELSKPSQMWDWHGRLVNSTAALMCDQIDVSGTFMLMDSMVDGAVSLKDARIGAYAHIFNSTISNLTPDGKGMAIIADRAEFRNGCMLGPKLTLNGKASFLQARIGGHLDLTGATLNNETPDGAGMALDAQWSEVDHAVLPPGIAGGDAAHGLQVRGGISFENARIGRGAVRGA